MTFVYNYAGSFFAGETCSD